MAGLKRKPSAKGATRLTPKRAKEALRVARVVLPVVIPLIKPHAAKIAGAVRASYDRYQAKKLGVQIDQLPEYTGHGASLQARIAGASDGITGLPDTKLSSQADKDFAAAARQSLIQLAAAVRTAERMPSARRKTAHRTIDAELSRIENKLLSRLTKN